MNKNERREIDANSSAHDIKCRQIGAVQKNPKGNLGAEITMYNQCIHERKCVTHDTYLHKFPEYTSVSCSTAIETQEEKIYIDWWWKCINGHMNMQLPFPKDWKEASTKKYLQQNFRYGAHHANDHALDFSSPSSPAHALVPPWNDLYSETLLFLFPLAFHPPSTSWNAFQD